MTKKKKKERKIKNRRKISRKKYYIPLTDSDDLFSDAGYTILLNPAGDRSCQSTAVSDQLRRLGIERSAKTLRQEVVDYLRRNADTVELRN